jgi:DNA-binding PadR family transcriptional regulator
MLAEGFKIAFLAGLVRDGLVTAELTAARVVWVQITELGREALTRWRSVVPGRASTRGNIAADFGAQEMRPRAATAIGSLRWRALTRCRGYLGRGPWRSVG